MAFDKTELRGDAPTELVMALDAIAQANGTNRTALVNRVLFQYVNKIAHKSMLIQRMSQGNALLSEPSAPQSDWSDLT